MHRKEQCGDGARAEAGITALRHQHWSELTRIALAERQHTPAWLALTAFNAVEKKVQIPRLSKTGGVSDSFGMFGITFPQQIQARVGWCLVS